MDRRPYDPSIYGWCDRCRKDVCDIHLREIDPYLVSIAKKSEKLIVHHPKTPLPPNLMPIFDIYTIWLWTDTKLPARVYVMTASLFARFCELFFAPNNVIAIEDSEFFSRPLDSVVELRLALSQAID